MQKIIIGIHGLQNKVSHSVLEDWWIKSIKEGLWAIKQPRLSVRFHLTYWAHILYSQALDHKEKNQNHPLFIREPYAASQTHIKQRPGKLRKYLLDSVLPFTEKIAFNKFKYISLNRLGYFIIKKKFKDLDLYYHDALQDKDKLKRPVKEIVRQELAKILKRYRKWDIMLIAHSMGAIVAYDVLTGVCPDIPIHTLVTIGSPLGMPLVKKEILDEQENIFRKEPKLVTPENVGLHWYDFADLNDNITMNYHLQDDYAANARGVRVKTTVVNNNYVYNNQVNPHKVYGYLRTPEVARVIDEFLREGALPFWEDIKTQSAIFIMNKFYHKHKPELLSK